MGDAFDKAMAGSFFSSLEGELITCNSDSSGVIKKAGWLRCWFV